MANHLLNVRCCCQPTKILGQLPVSDPSPSHFRVVDSDGQGHLIEIREVWDYLSKGGMTHESAIYSEDRPIAFWRTIPGFVEEV